MRWKRSFSDTAEAIEKIDWYAMRWKNQWSDTQMMASPCTESLAQRGVQVNQPPFCLKDGRRLRERITRWSGTRLRACRRNVRPRRIP